MSDALFTVLVVCAVVVLMLVPKIPLPLIGGGGLLALFSRGILTETEMLRGFSHPALWTVVFILVITRGLQNAGVIELVGLGLDRIKLQYHGQATVLAFSTMGLSAFVNDIGALAMAMPIGIRLCWKSQRSPAQLLMILSFAALLGGMITKLGTPPNMVVSGFREAHVGAEFGIFDFTPVGLTIAVVGVAGCLLLAPFVMPNREGDTSSESLFEVQTNVRIVRVRSGSPVVGQRIRNLKIPTTYAVTVIALLSEGQHIDDPKVLRKQHLKEGDEILLDGNAEAFERLCHDQVLDLIENDGRAALARYGEVEFVVQVSRRSRLVGRTVHELKLRDTNHITVIAVARGLERLDGIVGAIKIQAGDILWIAGERNDCQRATESLRLRSLDDSLVKVDRRKAFGAVAILAACIGAIAIGGANSIAALGIGAAVMVVFRLLSEKEAYKSVEMPIVILMGTTIPLGAALEKSGGARMIADAIFSVGIESPHTAVLVISLATVLMVNAINGTAAAALMCPIALNVSKLLGISVDPLLMAISFGASAGFLTPLGHKCNLYVMSPGGYRALDFLRLGWWPALVVVILSAWMIPMYFKF